MTNIKIQNLVNAIKQLITNHANTTASSSQKGHVKAGGTPQTIGDSLTAGTDNGLYARADHVHTVDYSKVKNKPTVATTNTNGLLSSDDKKKIDNTPNIRYGVLSGTTSAFTVSINDITELTAGTLIACYNAVGNSVSGATLKVNNFDALPIYYKASAITGSYLQNKTFNIFMYNNQIVNTGCWQLLYGYDSNTKYTAASAISGADTASGAVGTSANYAREDHSHPQSTLYAESNHIHSNYLTSQDISGKENTSNKVTSISSSSTNTQYPSAKCVYDYIDSIIGDIEEDMLS